MPRAISQASLDALSKKAGGEPITIVQIQWANDAPFISYSDRYVDNLLTGKILEVADLESVIDISKSGNTVSLKVKLDDSDGSLKSIIDQNDIHERPVFVYQWFKNLPISEMFLIFEGGVASPIEWNEGDRTLSFDVLSKIFDVETGFSVEEGDFINVPQTFIGKAWPLVFGTVINAPTVPIDEIPSGSTLADIGIPDYSLSDQLELINVRFAEQMAKAACYSRVGAQLKFLGNEGGLGEETYKEGQQYEREAQKIYNETAKQLVNDRTRLTKIQQHQRAYDLREIPILNGEFFQQGVEIQLTIKDALYTGTMNGSNFHVTSRKGPLDPVYRLPGTDQVIPIPKTVQTQTTTVLIENLQQQDDEKLAEQIFGGPSDPGIIENDEPTTVRGDPCQPPNFYFITNTPIRIIDPAEKKGFWYAAVGTSVKPGGIYPLRHMVGIVPGLQVLSVQARVTVNNIKKLAPVPSQYFSVGTVQYGPIIATIVTLKQPLSTILYQDWEDEIFCSIQSPIGPNVVDVIIWLIQTYTQYGIDLESFQRVRIQQENYPVGFILYERRNIVQLLKDIAYQARCAIWLRGGKFYIKYLPERADPIETITEDDVETGSMVISTTPTEDLVTRYTAKFKTDLSLSDDYVVVRYNIEKYGLKEQNYDFFIYNSAALVQKSVIFWMIRLSNTWKILKCKTFISKLKIETMDNVLLNFTLPWIANGPVNGLVERCTFNSHDYSINLEIWLPVLLGSMTVSDLAYPYNANATVVFPLQKQTPGHVEQFNVPAGDFSPNVIFQDFFPPSKGGKTVQISDSVDTLSTTVPIYNMSLTSISNPQTGLAPGTQPTYDYKYRDYPVKNANTPEISKSSIPGEIVRKIGPADESENAMEYEVRLFPFGLNSKSVDGITAIQLQQDPDDEIPAGSIFLVSKIVYYKKGKPTVKYYLQAPVWLSSESV